MSARTISVLFLIFFVGTQLAFLSPIAFHVSFQQIDSIIQNAGLIALARTLAFAAAASIGATVTAFGLAVTLWRLPTRVMGPLGLALLPALIGNVGLAVVASKTGWWPDWLQERQTLGTWLFLLAVELLQWTPTFTLLFWLRLKAIPKSQLNFSFLNRLTLGERLHLIALPHLKDLATLLLVVGYVSAAAEYAKSHVILRVSRGTETEFASHWLERIYRQVQTYDPPFATIQSMGLSGWFAVALLAGCALTVSLARLGAEPLIRTVKPIFSLPSSRQAEQWSLLGLVSLLLVVGAASFPVVVLVLHRARPSPEMLALLSEVTPLALTTGLLAGLISIIVAISLRLGFPRRLSRFTAKSLPIFLVLFLFKFIPAVGLAFCGYYWLQQLLAAAGTGVIVLSWICSQILLVTPFLVAFTIVINFEVKEGDLTFSSIHRFSFFETSWLIFAKNAMIGYLLILLFSISFIWNEDTVTSMLSVHIPAFAPKLLSKVAGRSADWREAATLLVPVVIFSALASFIWTVLSRKIGPSQDDIPSGGGAT